MRHYLAKIGSALLLVGVVVGAMWFDRANNTAPTVDAVVERVIDGDTIDVRMGQQRARVRLVGIDAPELSQDQGRKVQAFLAGFIQGQPVRVALGDKDKYGRSLGEVFVTTIDPQTQEQSQVSINAFMVRTGRAWAYRYRGQVQYSEYGNFEAEARRAQRGVWASAGAVEPWQWRKTQANQ